MKNILFILCILSFVNLKAQNFNNNVTKLIKGTSCDTVIINEPPNLDLSMLVGVRNDAPITGLNLEFRYDFQSFGLDTYFGKELDTSNPCFLCHKNIWKLNTVSYVDLGLSLTWTDKPNPTGIPKLIVAGRLDTNADISFVTKLNLKNMKMKLLLGQRSGFELHFVFF